MSPIARPTKQIQQTAKSAAPDLQRFLGNTLRIAAYLQWHCLLGGTPKKGTGSLVDKFGNGYSL